MNMPVARRAWQMVWILPGMFSALISARAHAAEAWADARLPVREGLVLWLDASRQPSGPAKNGAPVGVWFDGSGNKRDAVQAVRTARPVVVAGEGKDAPAALEFDGTDDGLLVTVPREPVEAVTLFLVAAPRSNGGFFRGMFAGAALGQNDYTSGVNVDLGPGMGARFNVLNVEGAGAGGAANLLNDATSGEFHTLRTITVTSSRGEGGIGARMDGKASGKRTRAGGSVIRLDQIAIGSRLFSNEATPPFVQGFFDGFIAEVILFGRVLKEDELASVEKYLLAKYEGFRLPPGEESTTLAPGARKLTPVKDPPAVQVFVPGFTARRLPLELSNINNVRYRQDGKVLALAYDGNVHLLSDTDGDGLEDKATLFWGGKGKIQGPIGMALTPRGYAHGDGLFVASKGKVSLVVDTDKDDFADKEIVVAEGWTPLPHGVDALGVALVPDGSVLFGLGTANFTNAYLVEQDGEAKYDLKNERGTVLSVSPDFKRRQIVATGIRFPVALALNPHGDLFATDQEGATWLANGNPFDELLHVQEGRHYGFPPRHPKHLPNVIDEPSVSDFRPQHQSTCGLVFNVSVNGGRVFGPESWTGDAIVTGFSRGKLYRTQLVKTAAGYVARNHLLASMTMMPADACVTPAGDLLVATHGGAPDWGNGPAGNGALFKISYSAPQTPQPVLAYAASARELRVAFDKPVDPGMLKGITERVSVEFGEAVAAGDRFESLRPGYEVVQRQLLAPRFGLEVHGVQMTPDRRTLVLQTPPMSRALDYAITFPVSNATAGAKESIPQHDAIDLGADLTGVRATWTPGDGKGEPTWTGWLPHLDLAISASLTRGSAEHERLWEAMRSGGVLRFTAQLDLSDMLRPAVQPGSRIDYQLPRETVTVTFAAKGNLDVEASPDATPEKDASKVSLTIAPRDAKDPKSLWTTIKLSLAVPSGGDVSLNATWHTNEDRRPRALPLRRILVPWASQAASNTKPSTPAEPQLPPELAGGDWKRGRTAFLSEQAMCGKCHRLHDIGTGKIGPDLTNLHHRDYASVLQDVLMPSAAINPDHVAFAITLKDGRVLNGVPRSEGDGWVVGEPGGQETRVGRSEVRSMEPLATSIMPHAIDQVIGADALRDLMMFLLTPPLEPVTPEIPGAPAPRTRTEVEAVLKASSQTPSSAPTKPLRIVLAAGPKDHGPGEHDYPAWQRRWKQLLSRADGVDVETAFGWPESRHFESADVIVFYSNNPGWDAGKAKQLDDYLERGGGLVYLHYAVDGHAAPEILGARIGLAWRGGASKFRHGPLDLRITDPNHPITRGFQNVRFVDESYWQLIGDASHINLLATGTEEGAPRPLLWTHEPRGPEKGRVFVSIPGHYAWTFDDPLFRLLIFRGMLWTGRQPTERLDPLLLLGAQIQ